MGKNLKILERKLVFTYVQTREGVNSVVNGDTVTQYDVIESYMAHVAMGGYIRCFSGHHLSKNKWRQELES